MRVYGEGVSGEYLRAGLMGVGVDLAESATFWVRKESGSPAHRPACQVPFFSFCVLLGWITERSGLFFRLKLGGGCAGVGDLVGEARYRSRGV